MATRSTRKKRKTNTKSQPLPGWVWLITGLVIGLSATFFPSMNEKAKQNEVALKEEASITPAAKRTFDFYTLLPELEVVVDGDNPAKSNTTDQSRPAGEYVLQVGSFKSSEEADSLKAQLALMGVETNIETVKVNTVDWHRVRVGPSKDINQLQTTQNRLRAKNMDSILLKVRS